MNDRQQKRSSGWALLLAVLLLAAQPNPAPASGTAEILGSTGAGTPVAQGAVLANWQAFWTDKERLIQVAAVVGAIAIFLLTRSTK